MEVIEKFGEEVPNTVKSPASKLQQEIMPSKDLEPNIE